MGKAHRIDPATTARARRLRKEAPFPERLLWGRLRGGQVGGLRFRRQHPVGPYIADFYCASAKLVIELDGVSHDERATYDGRRTRFMESRGLRVIRFTDNEVVQDVDDVVYRVACEVGLDV